MARRQRRSITQDLILIGLVLGLAVGSGVFLSVLGGDTQRVFSWFKDILVRDPSPENGLSRSGSGAVSDNGGCAYCTTLKSVHAKFEVRLRLAQSHAASLARAMEQTDEERLRNAKRAELAAAKLNIRRALTAAKTLGDFLTSCESEDFCKIPAASVSQASCMAAPGDDAMRGPANGLAAAVKAVAMACVASACPSIDCEQASDLRSQVGAVVNALHILGTPIAPRPGSVAVKDVPVGAATLAEELKHIVDEADYAAKMFPMMLEPKGTGNTGLALPASRNDFARGQLPAMAPEMIASEARAVQQTASDFVDSSGVSPIVYDPRREAAWRLKSLSLALAEVGSLSSMVVKGDAVQVDQNWGALAHAWGTAMYNIASINALRDRLANDKPNESGCDGILANSAQEAREALALLDLCQLRSSCRAKATAAPLGSQGDTLSAAVREVALGKDSGGSARTVIETLVPRAQAAVALLTAASSATADRKLSDIPEVKAALVVEGICRRDANGGLTTVSTPTPNGIGGPNIQALPAPLPIVPALTPPPPGGATVTESNPQP